MKKTLIRLGIALLTLVLVVVVALFAFGRFLATPEGSRWGLFYAQSILAKDFATEIKFSKAKVDLFSELSLDDLSIVSNYKDNRIEIAIHQFDCVYAFDFWGRNLRIKNVLVDHPQFNVDMKAAASEKTEESPAKTSSREKSLGDMIQSPPVSVELENFELRSMELHFKTESEGKKISSEIHDLNLKAKFSLLKNHLATTGQLKARQANAFQIEELDRQISGSWNAHSEWQVQVEYQNDNWEYSLKPVHIEFALDQFAIHKKADGSELRIAIPAMTFISDSDLKTKTHEFGQFDRGSVKVANDSTKVLVKALSLLKIAENKTTRLNVESSSFELHSELKDKIEIQASSMMRHVDFPDQFNSPLNMKFDSKFTVTTDLMHIENKTGMSLSEILFLNAVTSVGRSKAEDPWAFESKSQLFGDARFAHKIKPAASLAKMGSFEMITELAGKVTNDKDLDLKSRTVLARILLPVSGQPFVIHLSSQTKWLNTEQKADIKAELDLSNLDFGDWRLTTDSHIAAPGKEISGSTEITELKAPRTGHWPVQFPLPMKFTHQAKMDGSQIKASLKGEIPEIDAAAVGVLRDTHFDFGVFGDPKKDLSLNLSFDQGAVQLKAKLPADIPIASMKMKLAAKIQQQSFFSLDQFQFTLNQDLVKVTADGSGNLKTKDLQIQMNSKLLFPKNFPEVMGQKLSGEINVPLSIAVRRGRDLSFDGTLDLKDVGAMKADIGIESLTGRIPFSEHFIQDLGQIRFTELVTQNAFERVNFERLRPLLQSSDQISIRKIHWQEKVYGPLIGFVSIRQNMLLLHEFNLDLGSAGSLYGEMFFDAYPKNLQFGLLSRVTGVDLAQILPKKFLKKIPDGDKTISARTGFIFSINKAILDGRIDITQIGSAQMITLINVLDPQFQDDKMNKLRSLLELGYPTAVAMNFNQGYLDLDVALNVLGISQDESLRSIPLSGFLLKPTAEIVSASQKGPLK